jgi:5-methylcytosine-specific restriction endonuclease McrA
MPIDYKKYPKNWKTEIRPAILERAGHKCEFCEATNYQPHPATGSRVVLTVAHLDHDVRNNSHDNLRALCQRCHLRYDAKHHAKNAAKTRAAKNLTMDLFEEEKI